MVSRRESALSLLEELGEQVPAFTLQAHLSEDAQAVGDRLRTALRMDVETQLDWRDEWQAWREWRAAAEKMGVLVFLFPKVELEETRGLALLRFPLPGVGVNSKEQPESRIYTLLHEIIHLMLAAGREEVSALQERRSSVEWEAVERFAEAAASYALIPEASLRVKAAGASSWDLSAVRQIARCFRVTPLAMATRLRASGLMDWPKYRAWKEAWNEYLATLPPRRSGPVHPVDKALGRNGRPYVQLVMEALAANRITSVDASRYLGLRFEHFDKLKESLSGGPGGGDADE